MADTFRYTQLSAEKLGNLFLQLAQLEKAGLPADKGFALIADSDKILKKRLYAVQRHVQAGKSIAEAGFRAGIFNALQCAQLDAAETAGILAELYQRLADYYLERAKRFRKIKSRCYYPGILLIISLFLQPLPALIAETINAVQYLQLSAGRLLLLIFAVAFALNVPTFLTKLGLKAVIDALQLQVPGLSAWLIKRQLNDFYFNLALSLAAGLSCAEALPKLVASIPNSVLRAQFRPALAMANSGESVTDILATVASIRGTAVLQVINSSEQSGSLAKGLQHFAQLEADDLALQDDMLAEWIPRLIYTGVVLWIARSLIGF